MNGHHSSNAPSSGDSAAQILPVLYLEVCRGQSTQPLRPVLKERFLIGSAEACDLQLSGSDVPALHSVLVLGNGRVTFERVGSAPEALLNGRPVETALLNDGDVLEIGPFSLGIHVPGTTRQHQRPSPAAWHDPSDCMELDQFSAEDLIDLIEAEQQLVEEFDARQALGLAALMEAVLSHKQAATDEPAETVPFAPSSPEPQENSGALAGLEGLVQQLGRLAAELELRNQKLSHRESVQSDLVIDLAEAQKLLRRPAKDDAVPPAPRGNEPIRRAA